MADTPERNPVDGEADTLGKRIARARDRKRMTQLDLAALVLPDSKRVATISKWETDGSAPDANALAGLATALDVSADWLLFGDTEKPAPATGGTGGIGEVERRELLKLLTYVTQVVAAGPVITEQERENLKALGSVLFAQKVAGLLPPEDPPPEE